MAACPVCQGVNAEDAQRCGSCGTDLGEWDTQPSPLQSLDPIDSPGALWLDDLGEPALSPHAAEEPRATPPTVLRSEGGSPSVPDVVSRSAQKAAKRAEVRRRLRHSSAADRAVSKETGVLVLDPDTSARGRLCDVLGAFGFGVHAVGDAAEAFALVASGTFVAAFIDIGLVTTDGGDGIDLCKQLRSASRPHGPATIVLVLTATRLQPLDRVRADLAGCDEVILKPATRGIVAGLLDARGIALPSDARRSTRASGSAS
jgi:CheY-like chemotaxis protein